jgi:hypothetical protein
MRITRRLAVGLCLAVSLGPILTASDKPPQQPETPHLDFVTEYVRELAAMEDIRASGEKELKQGTGNDAFSVMIHTSSLGSPKYKSAVRCY